MPGKTEHSLIRIVVGATRFEHATPCSQSRCSSQAELRPDAEGGSITTNADLQAFDAEPLAQSYSGSKRPA